MCQFVRQRFKTNSPIFYCQSFARKQISQQRIFYEENEIKTRFFSFPVTDDSVRFFSCEKPARWKRLAD